MPSYSHELPPRDGIPSGGSRPSGDLGRLANYRIIEELGRGGQGIVYLAEDLRLRKKVALKVLRDAGDISAEALGRLRREVEAAARLNHPAICGVHEAVLDGHSPFIAMNYVEGRTLADAIAAEQRIDDRTVRLPRGASCAAPPPTPIPDRPPSGPSTRHDILRVVGIVEKVARALHVAHEAKVVHRDIKPTNIILTPEGEPVILDFGLAHFEESGLAALTKTGEIWGTPAYLSPEQLQGNRIKVDRRTDVWSLGVTLYECLTLRRPFEGPTSNQIFHAIQSKEPPDPCRVNRALPVDVRIVLETALEKDRDRRYESALAFADDLKAIREDQPIAARPIGRLTRLSRWARRNPGVAASLLLTFGVLVTGIIVAWVLVLALNRSLLDKDRALQQRDQESVKKDEALKQSKGLRLLAESSAALSRDPGLSLLLAREGGALAPTKMALTNGALNDALAELRERRTLAGHVSPVETAEISRDGSKVATTTAEGDTRVWDATTGESLAVLTHAGAFRASFTPSGRCVVTTAGDGSTRIWDSITWVELASVLPGPDGINGDGPGSRSADWSAGPLRDKITGVDWVSVSADASRILTVRSGEGIVWDPESGARLATLQKTLGRIFSIAFSLDATRIVSVAQGGVTLWDATTGREIGTSPPEVPLPRRSRPSPDGRRVIAIGDERSVVWTHDPPAIIELGETARSIEAFEFSRDGDRLVAVTKEGIRVWNLETGEARLLCGPDATQSTPGEARVEVSRPDATFTHDGRRVVSASCHGTAHVWSADSGAQLATLSGQAGDVRFVNVSPDGSFVLTAASTGTATLWDANTWNQIATLKGHAGEIRHATFSLDGSLVVTASADRTARVWETRNWPGAPLLEGHQGPVNEIAFSARGEVLLTASSSEGRPRVWGLKPFHLLRQLVLKGQKLTQVRLSPDGSRVVARAEDGTAKVMSVATGDVTATLRGTWDCSVMGFSPDGQKVVTASEDGSSSVWDAMTGNFLAELTGHAGAITLAAFCAEGDSIVTASEDRTVRFWSSANGAQIASVPGNPLQRPEISPDTRRVAIVSPEGEICICDAATGATIATLRGVRHTSPRFTPDGRHVVTESPEGTFRIWDVATGADLAGFPRNEGDVLRGFSPDSATIITSAKDGNVWLWNAATGAKKFPIPGHGTQVTGALFSPDGRLIVVSWSDETRAFDSSTLTELWTAPRRHGSISTIRFSPDGFWFAVGYAGGLVRLWPANPLAKARAVEPRELTLQEIAEHEVDDDHARAEIGDLFRDYLTNDDLVAMLERREGLSDRLRRAAITAARLRDPHVVAEHLSKKAWRDVLTPYRSESEYAMALRRAEVALGMFPGVELGKTTLGAAQFRAGLMGAALATLEQAAKASPHASTSIFIAMAHAKLGQLAEAETALLNARKLLDSTGSRPPEDIRNLYAEAQALLAAQTRPAGR